MCEHCNLSEEQPEPIAETVDPVICDQCGDEIPQDDTSWQMVNDQIICADCLDSYAPCDQCRELTERDELTEIIRPAFQPEHVCESCRDEDYALCSACDGWFRDSACTQSDSGEWYCDSCYSERYTTCDHCDREVDSDETYSVEDDSVCESCYYQSYNCEGCGESFWRNSVERHEGEWYCESCMPEESIHCYSYRPRPEFRSLPGEKRRVPFFGIELEVSKPDGEREDCESAADDVTDIWSGHIYCKEDSSTCGSGYVGFEIVSHPATWAWWKSQKDTVGRMLADLQEAGFRSYATNLCGMHIHVSRSAVSPLETYKLIRLVYDSPALILKLSCRRAEQLNRWSAVEDRSEGRNRIKLSKGKGDSINRYTALNFTEHTIEFRVFRGTLSESGFWRNLEIVQSMLAYVKVTGLREVSGDGYLAYVRANKKDYPNLAQFIAEKF